jgi:dinuclear metal center YbgI/SA1388 family protein
MPTVNGIIKYLERIAPAWMAEQNDSIGLQVGEPQSEVTCIAVAVNPSEAVIDRSITEGAQLLVTHHPLIRNPLKSLDTSDPTVIRAIKLIRANIALFVLHTNFDVARGGVNDVLAERLGLRNVRALVGGRADTYYKVVVFVPDEALANVREAMARAGAGIIGNYSSCSFRTKGIGSFVAESGAQPYVGSLGCLEEVEEWRLEMICTHSVLADVLTAMRDAHPYEEVAYDIYQLANNAPRLGLGRVGMLDQETTLAEYADFVRQELSVEYPRVFGDAKRPVKTVAICGGGGARLYWDAVSAGADVFVTADWKYHDIQNALALGMAVIDAGHFETEKPGVVALAERLAREFTPDDVVVKYVE